jgi:DNA-binding CsgD family transcriptional regulator
MGTIAADMEYPQVDGRMDVERVSSLIGDIYDAALDPPLWRGVLKDIRAFVSGGPCAALFWQDAANRTGDTYYVYGGDPEFGRLYWDKYFALNPFTAAAAQFPIEGMYSAADIMPLPEFVQTSFYKQWMAPQDWGDVLSANLDKSATSRAVFCVARHSRDGVVDDEMRRRMRLLVPHVRRSAIIGKLINLGRVEAAALADTFDGLEAGMFLVDSTGRLLHTNASGRAMLSEGHLLHANGRLVALDAQGGDPLGDLLLAAGHGDAALGEKGIAVQMTASGGDQFVTHVMPLTSGARRQTGAYYGAAAAVFVQRATHDASPAIELLVGRFDLTRAEVRVLTAMMQFSGVAEVASSLKLSPATVRTHLRHIFEKTGARRQADLVKLMTRLPPPIVARDSRDDDDGTPPRD